MIIRPTIYYDFIEIAKGLKNLKFNPKSKIFAENTESRTFIIDGMVAMIMGVTIANEGIGEIWNIPTPLIQGKGRAIIRESHKLREIAIEKFGLRQIRASIDSSSPDDIKWIEILGFKHEATLKEATPKRTDLLIYRYEGAD